MAKWLVTAIATTQVEVDAPTEVDAISQLRRMVMRSPLAMLVPKYRALELYPGDDRVAIVKEGG